MKPLLENISLKKGEASFLVFALVKPKFDFFWHYHPEYELTLIINGSGRRLVGDSNENFESGDLVLIGPGIPHTWVNNRSINGKSEAIVIQFSEHFIERFSGLEELFELNKLLTLSKQGISINGKKTEGVKEQIKLLPTKTGLEKIISLLQILNNISNFKSTTLASSFYYPLKGKENTNRINKVCQFVQKHATEPLTINKAASLINLSPSAFCKFFKRITGTTFSDYVNDIRIANVCCELMETDKQIAEIAFGNGFETLSYFNKVFLKKKKFTPSSYRNQ